MHTKTKIWLIFAFGTVFVIMGLMMVFAMSSQSASINNFSLVYDANSITIDCDGRTYACSFDDDTQGWILTGIDSIPAEINLPDTLLGYPITIIGTEMFKGNATITSIASNTVQIVQDNAFNNCANLSAVCLPNLKEVKDRAFYSCRNLETVTADNIEEIGAASFAGGTGFNNKLSTLNLSNVTSISDGAFSCCTALEDIGSLNDDLVTIPKNAFYNCSSLTTIDLKNVTSIGEGAFGVCSNLSEIDLSKVTSLGKYPFMHCKKLTTINSFNSNLTTLPYGCFGGCTSLTNPEFSNLTNLEEIAASCFSACSSLSGIANLFNSKITTIGQNAFYGTNITALLLPNSVTSCGSNITPSTTYILFNTETNKNFSDLGGPSYYHGTTANPNINHWYWTTINIEIKLYSYMTLKETLTLN